MVSVVRTGSLAAALAIVVALAGCSGGDDPSGDAGPVTTAPAESSGESGEPGGSDESGPADTTVVTAADVATTVPTTATVPATTAVDAVIDIEDQPGEGTFAGALDDTDVGCEQNATGWGASGTVTNPTDAGASYRIFISFVDGAGETLALLQAEDDLAAIEPGGSRDWSVGFDTAAEGLTCVARVERRAD